MITKMIQEELLQEIRKSECWSKDNMTAHGAEDRSITYIGSKIEASGKVWDYYADETGAYWYDTRWIKADNSIISMAEHIGIKIKKAPA